MQKYFNKVAISLFIITFIFSPIFAVPARAQWVVFDPSNFVPNSLTAVGTQGQMVKDYGLDAVAWVIVNLIIERIAASTVNWINSGFQGSPAYVTDPGAYFKGIGDRVAGQYIFSNPNLNFLCGPIQAKVRLALSRSYNNDYQQWQCTLTDVVGNIEGFMNDFSQGGWDGFFELTQKPQNNPLGAYIQAETELSQKLAQELGDRKNELDWGSGFMSWKQCPEGMEVTNSAEDKQYTDAGYKVGDCLGTPQTMTPGSVIENQLNNVLNSGNNKLAAADEINEIVSALLNQLVSRVVGGIGGGLRGASQPSGTEGNSFTKLLTDSTASSTTDYFNNSQDTSIFNQPLYNPDAALQQGSNAGSSQPTPNDPDCQSYTADEILNMAIQKIESDSMLTSADLNQVIIDLDCVPR